MTDPAAERIIGLYDDQAPGWVADRGSVLGFGERGLDEQAALDAFASQLPVGGSVLDVGCGSGWPWGAALLDRGFQVTGVDSSPRLIAHAATTLAAGEWRVGDLRTLDLGRTFDGLLVWYSLFHLTPEDQRSAFARILDHGSKEAVLLMTAGGHEAGVSIGSWRGEPLYHASLGAEAYRAILTAAGFQVIGPAEPERITDRGYGLARRAIVSAE